MPKAKPSKRPAFSVHTGLPRVSWTPPEPHESAIGECHGEAEAAAAIVHAGVQGGSGQGGAAERQERRVVARELDLTETSLAERQGGGTAAAG